MNTVQRLFVLIVAAGTAGCASRGPLIEAPAVELTAVSVEDLSFREQSFSLSFDVANPNAFALPIRSIAYVVELEGQRFAAGESAASFSVPARGRGSFELGVSLDLLNSATSLGPLLRAGSARPLNYALRGRLEVAIPFARPLEFARAGTIVVR